MQPRQDCGSVVTNQVFSHTLPGTGAVDSYLHHVRLQSLLISLLGLSHSYQTGLQSNMIMAMAPGGLAVSQFNTVPSGKNDDVQPQVLQRVQPAGASATSSLPQVTLC